jgi:hypothetical protein
MPRTFRDRAWTASGPCLPGTAPGCLPGASCLGPRLDLAWTLDRLDLPGPPGCRWTACLDLPGALPGPRTWTSLDRLACLPGLPGAAWTAWTLALDLASDLPGPCLDNAWTWMDLASVCLRIPACLDRLMPCCLAAACCPRTTLRCPRTLLAWTAPCLGCCPLPCRAITHLPCLGPPAGPRRALDAPPGTMGWTCLGPCAVARTPGGAWTWAWTWITPRTWTLDAWTAACRACLESRLGQSDLPGPPGLPGPCLE